GDNAVERFRAIEDTAMTVNKHLLKLNGVNSEQEFEEKYKEKLDGSTYLKHYVTKEDSVYIAKHGIPDTW
ncbi:hypothetical protein, partial [Tenacibaculum ovolyticum]|uniref:hypothetical protein n=1 Tax=Tenacibaculum ovolyticum TaxID=104270 RepID=UPI001F46F507